MQSKVISRKSFLHYLHTLHCILIWLMWAECEPKTAKLAEMRAEFRIFESNAPGLKANFYEPCVDMPTIDRVAIFCKIAWRKRWRSKLVVSPPITSPNKRQLQCLTRNLRLVLQGGGEKKLHQQPQKKKLFCGCWCNFFHRPLVLLVRASMESETNKGAVKKNCTNSHKKRIFFFCGCWCNFFSPPP